MGAVVIAGAPAPGGAFDYLVEGRQVTVEGELIAFGRDSVYFLDPEGIRSLPTLQVGGGSFALYYWPGGTMEVERVPAGRPDKMRTYARFPEGIPAGIDPRTIRR